MLWHKAWLESRARFSIAAGAELAACVVFVIFERAIRAQIGATSAPLNTYFGYIHRMFYGGGVMLPLMLVLGLGGLLREREHGTAAFTLALPVRRWQLVAVRAAVGLAEVVALSLLPALLVPTLSPLVHQSYPFSQAGQFGLLLAAKHALVFATAFLLSTVLAGQYTAFLVTWLLLIFHTAVAAWGPLRPYRLNINWITGPWMPYVDPHTALVVGPLPWMRLSIVTLLALTLIVVAARVTERQDF
jgi:ABC-2 type transport system permease protein